MQSGSFLLYLIPLRPLGLICKNHPPVPRSFTKSPTLALINISIFKWLAKTEGDKQICLDLKVTGNNVEITDRTDYRIKISTGDVKNGGTQQVIDYNLNCSLAPS